MPGIRVLIVEDSEIIQQRLQDRFAALAWVEVIGIEDSAAEAEASIRNLTPDVAILDIRLRSGSGIDVLASIQEDAVRPITIVVTNFSHPQYRKKCLEAGADYFLDKSTEFEKIPQIIDELNKQRTDHDQ